MTGPSGRQHTCERMVLRQADAAASFSGSPEGGSMSDEDVRVLPRLREKDPHRVLGIPNDSDFEEVQDARNFLIQVHTRC